jgi:hypothetical protein
LGKDFVSGTRGVKGKAHGAISLAPTLRDKAAKDGAPTVWVCQRKAGPTASLGLELGSLKGWASPPAI